MMNERKNKFPLRIVVIGAGAWGSAIANLIAKNFTNVKKNPICLIANDQQIINEINNHHCNSQFLPKVKLSKNIKACSDLENEIKNSDLVFIVTPSQAISKILKKISGYRLKPEIGLVICSKGFDFTRQKFLSELVEDFLPGKNYAILSGPNFASEVALNAPTITSIASKNKKFADKIAVLLQNDYFKSQYSKNILTIQLCGIVKNIMAIGCGIIDGLDLGQNAKSALILQGINEIILICKKLKISSDLNNPAGFGDIFLTCSSTKSRNNLLGFRIASGKKYSEIKKSENKTYEGVIATKSIAKLAKKLQIELVLCKTIEQILSKDLSIAEIKILITKSILSNE
jgi:glycerol-3-phosphate dehydrogenase (NAD(P)+)